ncbi:uncharacterized protein LOC134841388 isoform X2 [Symsagittifera roscoffensis]|uniref:uncharacterized protein LOC134841388 isoform X2 n=1 Tax=Symsagittifera roscoffensis TaxID=84072 RepID=UPI00307B231D
MVGSNNYWSTSCASAFLMLVCCFGADGEDQDFVEDGTFFCVNCAEGVECCSGVMGLPFCCDPSLYAVQKVMWAASVVEKLSLGGHLVTCQSNDDCPTIGGALLKMVDDNAGGDYCCPLENMCCPFGKYLEENYCMLSYSFGGPAIFSIFLAMVSFCLCCVCCCRMCSKRRQKNAEIIVMRQDGSTAGVALQGTSTVVPGILSDGLPPYQKLHNAEDVGV